MLGACAGPRGASPGFSANGHSYSCPSAKRLSSGPYLDRCFFHWLRSACLGGDFGRRLAAGNPSPGLHYVQGSLFCFLRLQSWTFVSGALFWLWRGPIPPHRPRAKSMPTGSVLSECPIPWVPGTQNSLLKCPSLFQNCRGLFPISPACGELTRASGTTKASCF